MGKSLSEFEKGIKEGQRSAKNAKKVYQLLSTYNAYNILLLEAKQESERKKIINNQHYPDSDCYEDRIEDLFGVFKSNECLRGKRLSGFNNKDMLFLIDQNTLLRLNSLYAMNSHIAGLSIIDYSLLKITECTAKVYQEKIFSGDPYYCDYHWEAKDALGLFDGDNPITPGYVLNNQLASYDNMDIREILKQQSLDEIYEKITEAKNTKVKKLVLTKC